MASSYYTDDTVYTSLASSDAVITAITGSVAAAAASAAAASASAAAAAAVGVGFTGTSTTSVAIATGSKSFTANLNKLWIAGSFLTLDSSANSANYMHGAVTSYNSGTGALVMNVLDIGGSGTLADWNISLSGTQGSTGATGATGATGPSGALGVSGTPTVNQFGTWLNSTTMQGVSITGLVKGNGASAPTAAVANTDYAPVASPTFTGTVTLPTPWTLGAVSVTATGTQINYLAAATGTTGTTSANVVFSTSPTLVTPVLGVASATSINGNILTTGTFTLTGAAAKTLTFSNTLTLAGTDASTLNVGVGGTLTGSSSAAIFYDNIPQNSQSAAYTLVLADAQKHILHPAADTTARIYTIPANSSVAFPIGTAVTFINQNAGGIITISITTDTMRLAGPGTTGSRTLAANGIATAMKITATEWIISGTGLT